MQFITSLFQEFAGREVPMQATPIQLRDRTYIEYTPSNNPDPVIEAMTALAEEHGFSLRVLWQGLSGAADRRFDRLTAHIEQGADKTWRVSSQFEIG
jgi:hypothetical protein